MMIKPQDLATMLASDIRTIERLKTDDSVPMEIIPPLTDSQKTLLDHPQIPATSHARDHFFSYNDEIVRLVRNVLEEYRGEADAVLATGIGHTIVETRMVEYGSNKIRQLKIRLHKPVLCRRVWLPSTLADKTHLVRRHMSSSPGVDFWAPIDDSTKPYLSTVDTLIMTIRHHADGNYVLGTCFPGNKFPGEDDGTGIFYKWFKNDEERAADASSFINVLSHKIPVLLDATQVQKA